MNSTGSASGRILIIEDDADLRDSLIKYLRNKGLEVTGVGSAIEFYRVISDKKFHLVILDLALPDQDGMVLARYLRANTHMRIIILTARKSIEERMNGYDAGADIYIIKPIDFRELFASIMSLLARQGEDGDAHASDPKVAGNGWKLMQSEWSLRDPDGAQLKLTAKEYLFLSRLASERRSIVSRESILMTLGYENNEYGNRALESMIYRLRKKISATLDTPIKTASGSGYTFAASIDIC